MSLQYGKKLVSFQPILSVEAGVPGLLYTHLHLPVPALPNSGDGATTPSALEVNIDTGSVGIVLSANHLRDPETNDWYSWVEPTGQTMTIEYMPSKATNTGQIVKVTGLALGDGSIKIGPVRVLASESGGAMMGVGFGLEAIAWFGPASAQPQTPDAKHASMQQTATALDNPFLNIMAPEGVPQADFLPAYMISTACFTDSSGGSVCGQVTFGQTQESLEGFHFLPLVASDTSPSGFQLPWVNVAVTTTDGSQPVQTQAQLLMDAGISQMFLSMYDQSPAEPGVKLNSITPDLTNAWIQICGEAAGTKVLDYGFRNRQPFNAPPGPLSPDEAKAVKLAMEHYKTDPDQPASPARILPGGPSPQNGSFVNTGGHLLAIYDYVLDAANSRLGFRPRQPS